MNGLDPHTGRPATEPASVTVIGPHLPLTDAYATGTMPRPSRRRSLTARERA